MKSEKQQINTLLSSPDRIDVHDITPEKILEYINDDYIVKNYSKKSKLNEVAFNVPCAFDIETSSFYENDRKVAIMYIWMFGINGLVVTGRTWNQFKSFMKLLGDVLQLDANRRLIIYVQNYEFEFQFIRKLFVWDKIFAIDERQPLYAITSSGFEFRCSYMLTGSTLEQIGKDLRVYEVEKLVGDLDYKLIRHSATPLTEKEIGYCINDIAVLFCLIQEKIDEEGSVLGIPLTKTSYVRRYCRDKTIRDKSKGSQYIELMKELMLTPELYDMLQQAMKGGEVGANIFRVGKIYYNVSSVDFGSEYPFAAISEMYPMSAGETYILKSEQDFRDQLRDYCCLMTITFTNIREKRHYFNPLSYSKCYDVEEPFTLNNGRIMNAAKLTTTITEQDYFTILDFYDFDEFEITNFVRFRKNYLPRNLILAILELYKDKTTLKGVEDKVVEYLLSKGNLNSIYGMTVTDIVRDIYDYINNKSRWSKTRADKKKAITKYNNQTDRFIYYPWGVWITAYARRNLMTGIKEFGDDFIYSDTDSMKVLNYENHKDYFIRYHNLVEMKLKRMCDHHKIDFELCCPKTIKGESKLIGDWDFEGTYESFKTLGAKRYMWSKKGEVNLVVSGLTKMVALPYMCETLGCTPKIDRDRMKVFVDDEYIPQLFNMFDVNLYIPPEHTGKLTHTYIDHEQEGDVVDYLGNKYHYHEYSSIHLEGAEYTLSMEQQYIDLIFKFNKRL